jgi:Tfp pilus assembly protein PilF
LNKIIIFYPILLIIIFIGCSSTNNISTEKQTNQVNPIEAAEYYINKGNEYARRRDFNSAKINFLKATQLNPTDYKIWGLAGMAAKENSEFEEAIKYFQKTISLNPSEYMAFGNIGIINQRLKKYDAAISAFKRVLSLNSTDIEAAARLAEIYYENNDYLHCEEYMTRFEENLSKKNFNLLSDQTKKAIEHTQNKFVNYRSVIKEKSASNQPQSEQ